MIRPVDNYLNVEYLSLFNTLACFRVVDQGCLNLRTKRNKFYGRRERQGLLISGPHPVHTCVT